MQTLINKRTIKSFGVFQPSPSFLKECDWCCHPISEHGEEGCECTRTNWSDGIAQDGPCGCMAHEVIPEDKPVMPHGTLWLGIICIVVAAGIGIWLIAKDLMNPVNF